MEDRIKKIAALIAGHIREELNAEQEKELQDWINLSEANRQFFLEKTDIHPLMEEAALYEKGLSARDILWEKIMERTMPVEETKITVTRRIWLRIASAAAILVFVIAGAYLLWFTPVQNKSAKQPAAITTLTNDVAPGGNKAELILSDGSTIVLDNAQNGKLALQGNTQIIKQDGQLRYNAGEEKQSTEFFYNTLKTPRTGEYKLTLPDGSLVMLNSVSSIRYPTSFKGKTREVEITGEAYFEVSKDASRPFRVSILSPASGEKLSEVEVLGTEFNVMAYPDEKEIKTTLIEGSVKMIKNNQAVIIKPGEQAQVVNNSSLRVLNNADVDKEAAWKNGLFKFNSTDLKTIMRQLARWYDVEVIYKENIPADLLYNGEVPRNVNVSEVLKVLEYMGAHFKIEGKVITVLPG